VYKIVDPVLHGLGMGRSPGSAGSDSSLLGTVDYCILGILGSQSKDRSKGNQMP
jgi:hypothetical protein